MTPPRTVEVTPQTFIGVSLALLGVILTLDNLGFVNAQDILRFGLRFWPVIPILAGVLYVIQGRETRDWLLGSGWMAFGIAFLLRNLGVFHFRLRDFLPLILVAIGVRVMFGRRAKHRWPGTPDPAHPPPHPAPGPSAHTAATSWHGAPAQVLRAYSVLSGTERRHHGPLAHVEVSAVLGGCDIDLRDAVPTSDPLIMQVFAMWGGIDVKVPPGWVIQNEAWPILGGIVDSTTPPAVPTHRVILRGNAFMGGVEIKN